jgi:hypothetical protein
MHTAALTSTLPVTILLGLFRQNKITPICLALSINLFEQEGCDNKQSRTVLNHFSEFACKDWKYL